MKRFFSLILILALMVSLVSCVSDPDRGEESDIEEETKAESQTEAETEPEKRLERHEYSLKDHTDLLKLYGRMSAVSNGITCDFAASGIEFYAYVNGFVTLEVTAEDHTVVAQSDKNDDIYFAVFVDGVKDQKRYKIERGTHEIKIAYFDEPGTHTVRVVRQTEALNGLCTLNSLTFVGTLNQAPSLSPYYIEFIGDSITSGYCNLQANGISNAGDSDYKDATQAYAYLTAQELKADFSLVSCSGVGVTAGYVSMTAQQLFEQTSYFRSQQAEYVATRTPDVVVINLGTNDRAKNVAADTFKNDVKALIESVRAVYGNDVDIVWAYGMMNDGYIEHTLSVISELGGAAAGLYSVELERDNSAGGGHPNVSAHEASAQILAEFIRSNLQ